MNEAPGDPSRHIACNPRRSESEETMRKYVDCRAMGNGCTVAIAAEREDELMDAATQHMTSVHHQRDTPELRKGIKDAMKSGSPPP